MVNCGTAACTARTIVRWLRAQLAIRACDTLSLLPSTTAVNTAAVNRAAASIGSESQALPYCAFMAIIINTLKVRIQYDTYIEHY